MRGYMAVLLLTFLCSIAFSAGPYTVSENKFGIGLMGTGDGHSDGQVCHTRLAQEMIGDWGYVRTGGGARLSDVDEQLRQFIVVRAMRLTPVFTGLRADDSFYHADEPDRPIEDPDGSLTAFGAAHEEWARAVYEQGLVIPYFEFGNEVNAGYYSSRPELYARMCIAVSQALKRVDPYISFGTAGMAGNGANYYDAMLKAVPELVDHVDHWGLHPYANNHPPGFTERLGDYGLGSHRHLARVLARHGVTDPIFVMTETGYELGNWKNRSFPKITEENRALYLAHAYETIWFPDPRVRGVIPFMLGDARWNGWRGWDFIRNDFTLTPMYEAIRDMPKPGGSDFLPRGTAAVRGRIVERISERGAEDFLVRVWAPYRGTYATVTDKEGRFVIDGIPPGEWNLEGFRDGFENAFGISIPLQDESDFYVGTTMVGRPGWLFLGPGGEGVAAGWTLKSGSIEAFSMDTNVIRSTEKSQRIEADGRRHSIWEITGYESVVPGKVYAAEVWIKTENLVVGDGEGVAIEMELTDSFAQRQGGARVTYNLDGDTDWRPLTVVFDSIPTARRNRIYLSVEAESGTVWFTDLFLHEGTWPLPSKIGAEPGTHALRGSVFGPRHGARIQNALVCTSPGGFWTTTNFLGDYELTGLPEGEYDVWAFEPGYEGRCVRGVRVPAGEDARHDVLLAFEPVPDELIDPGFENVPRIPTWFSGWKRLGTVEGISANGWHKDTRIPEHPEGFQARSGNGFYGSVAGSNIKDGMIYQTITCEPDALYEVSVWHYTYQTNDGIRGDVANRLGVDPLGEENPDSPYALWTPYTPSHKKWSRLSLRVRPVNNRMTVFLHHLQVHGLVFNCNLFDDVEVRRIEE